jgi:hypothetical protein
MKVVPIFATAIGMFVTYSSLASAQTSTPLPPELAKRLEQEQADRKGCKTDICKAFATPTAGPPIACDITKTWLRDELTSFIVGGSTLWGYGHMKCSFKVNLDRGEIAKGMAGGKATFAEHNLTCDVDDKDPAKGVAFTVKAAITPVVTFDKGQATAVALDPVKTEGSTLASAAVTSIMTVDKISGIVSKSGVSEINALLFEKCKDVGVTITPK